MQIEVDESGHIVLKEVYSGITLVTAEGARLSVCMRDNGFELASTPSPSPEEPADD